MLIDIIVALSLAILPLLLWLKYAKTSVNEYRNLPLPPGPKPLPFIGNALDLPSVLPWRVYTQWANNYGDLIFVRAFGTPMLILNTLDCAIDLLEKRSSTYSDRLETEMVALMGWSWNPVTMGYSQWWRRHRRGFHQYFNQAAVPAYESKIHKSAQQMLKRLYEEPKKFADHIRYQFGANILSVVYGISVPEKDDENIAVAEDAMQALAEGFNPGAFWVDFLPILKHVPAWVPGAGFQKKAAQWKLSTTAMKEMSWKNAAKSILDQSIAARLSERIAHLEGPALAEEEDIAKNVCGVAYAGGIDTTVSTLHSFFLAMLIYPEVQKRAQEQLANVVGPNRLPEFSDQVSLPYIEAICKECMRWQPVVPLNVPHRSTVDDEYRGYYIPKGTLVIQNTWAILHDPKEYPDPEEFKPERFLKDGELNPEIRDPEVAFGAGRRICPGRYFSDMTLFMNVACILHTFDITPALDAQGKPIEVEPKMQTGILSHPYPFECTIKPRSFPAETLILHQGTGKN
ncbi:cytochrome P450 [Obba rivulosa]|uniref:Cytochrome P450 n=1 Tax=Obba rivulosa TaxID=1052685 RepID=A0A8E2ANS6_9APHY|nr:cytochrome P450 [Obba rivulosa]